MFWWIWKSLTPGARCPCGRKSCSSAATAPSSPELTSQKAVMTRFWLAVSVAVMMFSRETTPVDFDRRLRRIIAFPDKNASVVLELSCQRRQEPALPLARWLDDLLSPTDQMDDEKECPCDRYRPFSGGFQRVPRADTGTGQEFHRYANREASRGGLRCGKLPDRSR